MKRIPLTQGQYALVDNADYEELSKYKWYAYKHRSGNFYAVRMSFKNSKRFMIRMHRQILGLKRGDKREADHIDHNTLDNRQDNLRICTSQQNNMNREPRLNTTSIYKGVSWDEQRKKWRAAIQIKGKFKCLGCFKEEKDAALAYNKAAKKHYGEFAYLNVIGGCKNGKFQRQSSETV